jgi:hypothetical protein
VILQECLQNTSFHGFHFLFDNQALRKHLILTTAPSSLLPYFLCCFPQAQPSDVLADIMSTTVRTARATDKVSDISSHFGEISGLPVVDDQLKVIGVVSKKDLEKSSHSVSAHRRTPLYDDGRLAVLCNRQPLTSIGLTTWVILMSLPWPFIIEEMHGWDKASQQH